MIQTPDQTSTTPPAGSSLYVGTSGWAYPAWKPQFYPKNVASKNFLQFYATKLNAVEVNYTFRANLPLKTAENWMAQVGPDFRFVIKANQFITHIRRLNNVEEPLKRFLTTLEPLYKQLGPVLFQLPPNLKADIGLLRDFLAQLPRSLKTAFEFRHASWFSEQIYAAMRDKNAALCVSETESLITPEVRTAAFIYFRFREPGYSAEERAELALRLERCVTDGLETYAFLKHEEDPTSPLQAAELLESVRKKTAKRE